MLVNDETVKTWESSFNETFTLTLESGDLLTMDADITSRVPSTSNIACIFTDLDSRGYLYMMAQCGFSGD